MDSTAIAWWLRPEIAVFVNYGQRPAAAERGAAKALADAVGAEFHAVNIDCSSLGSGLLAGKASLQVSPTPEWWPYRNQLLVTFAASIAVRLGAAELMIGTVAEDVVNGDGTQTFVAALSALLSIQEGGLALTAPAIGLTSFELVERSEAPYEVLGLSHSCFLGDLPCLQCRGCLKHLDVLDRLGRRRARRDTPA